MKNGKLVGVHSLDEYKAKSCSNSHLSLTYFLGGKKFFRNSTGDDCPTTRYRVHDGFYPNYSKCNQIVTIPSFGFIIT